VTVAELIVQLADVPQDAEVYLSTSVYDGCGKLDEIQVMSAGAMVTLSGS
jgi:hypothetical protein